MQRHEDFIEKHEGGLIRAIGNDIDNTMDNKRIITRKPKWEEKQLYGRFERHLTKENLDVTKKKKTLKEKQNLSH